jgi:gluconolactonase
MLPIRYPDPAIRTLDPRFDRYRLPLAAVEQIADGCRWAEGPVWFGDLRCLLWSDIPNDRILRWDEETGAVGVFRRPSHNANGNTRDRQGRLVTCEHRGRCVTRTECDGAITVLADRYRGKRLNSPNDVVVSRDGAVWFTDPPFGILGYYEGERADPELPAGLYRLDPGASEPALLADDIEGPNGLAFSPDERTLYVVASREVPRKILAYDVTEGRTITRRRVLIDAGQAQGGPGGTPDGFRVDVDGNLWCGWGMGTPELDGVRVFAPDGTPIGHIDLPMRCANLCFGGRHRNRLFMAASQGVFALYVNTQGVAGG